MSVTRAEGFYWVRMSSDWEVALWTRQHYPSRHRGHWVTVGNDMLWDDGDFAFIGPRVMPPEGAK